MKKNISGDCLQTEWSLLGRLPGKVTVQPRHEQESRRGIVEGSARTVRKGAGFRASAHEFRILVPLIQPWDFRWVLVLSSLKCG